MKKIAFIMSGGQTGVERAALEFARENEIPISGWCPQNGWAEDTPNPPGLKTHFPELKETPSSDTAQQAQWNVRDSHLTLIIYPGTEALSGNASVAEKAAREMGRPLLKVWNADSAFAVAAWLMAFGEGLTLNITGPSASEWPQAHRTATKLLWGLSCALNEAEKREEAALQNVQILQNVQNETAEPEAPELNPVYLKALKLVIKEGKASISFIQRKCAVGYNRAGKIIEWMEDLGYVTPFDNRAESRKVLITYEEFLAKYGDSDFDQ